MKEYQSVEEAWKAISESEDAVNEILCEEFPEEHKERLTIGFWLEIYKHDKGRREIKQKLLDIERIMIDAHLFLRHEVENFDENVGKSLSDTFV